MAGKYILGRISQNRARAARYIVSEAILFLLLAILQTSVLGRVKLFGGIADLCFVGLLAVSYFCGRETGAVTGIAVGFLIEALGSVGISILPVLYLFCGYVCGYFTRAIYPKGFISFLVVLACGLPVRGAITLIYVCLTYSNIDLLQILLKTVLPDMAATALFGLILYYPIKRLCLWMGKA